MKTAAVRAVLLLSVLYVLAGILFGRFAGQAASHRGLVGWRWAAWIVSAVAFGAHIVYEQVWLRSSPRVTAVRVSFAAGLGAFGLAVAANVHAYAASQRQHSFALALSLAIWPVITALPAFVVALVAAMLVARLKIRAAER
jgi:hypothetical protein